MVCDLMIDTVGQSADGFWCSADADADVCFSVGAGGICLCLVRVRGPNYLMVIAPSSDLAEPDQVVSRLDLPQISMACECGVCLHGWHVGNGRTNE